MYTVAHITTIISKQNWKTHDAKYNYNLCGWWSKWLILWLLFINFCFHFSYFESILLRSTAALSITVITDFLPPMLSALSAYFGTTPSWNSQFCIWRGTVVPPYVSVLYSLVWHRTGAGTLNSICIDEYWHSPMHLYIAIVIGNDTHVPHFYDTLGTQFTYHAASNKRTCKYTNI